ncbi:MAG TPA: hypothetical protein VFG54_00205 [Prolixibacteraceae bacterium]|nr:hypothetical protein [Prolixibacteraceae bacterium]
MKNSLYYILTALLLFSSCQKEDEPLTPILAGVVDKAMIYKELNPALQVTLKHDVMRNIDYGKDSMDINQDGSFDIIISQTNLLSNFSANDNSKDIFPFYSLRVKNGVAIAVIEETYFVVINQISNTFWVDTIAYKANLENITDWSDNYPNIWNYETPPTIFFGYDGPWYGLSNEEKYIAVRIKANLRYRYGWIKILVNYPQSVSIISYALEE